MQEYEVLLTVKIKAESFEAAQALVDAMKEAAQRRSWLHRDEVKLIDVDAEW